LTDVLEIVLKLCTKKVQKEIYMNKFYTEFIVKVSVSCEIQANSIDEAKSLVEDEIRNQFQISFEYETNETSVVSFESSEVTIDETFTEFKIEELDKSEETEESAKL
jgi:hypothetical protein